MKRVFRRLLSFLLVISFLMTSSISALAVDGEEYICELRLVYAEDAEEARAILDDGEFSDYEIYNADFNAGTGEIGVFLAYKTTENIEDAITDITVMQMNGGYQEGNYQEMLKESYDEYIEMSEVYLRAVNYFIEAYDAGHYLAEAAYRQLNLYTSITDEDLGIEIPYFDGEKLGDVFYNGIDSSELALMFMQGNSHAMGNIRSLLAMGVSYNEDGKTYFEKVAEAAKEMTDDPDVFADEAYDELAFIISATIIVLQEKFEELTVFASELNYKDETLTEREASLLEAYGMSNLCKEVEYLNGKTLYDFCVEYDEESEDFTDLYPMVAALNDGQVALTQVAHHYDVMRYSVSSVAENVIDSEIEKLEEVYEEKPFNIYTGVDRSIYNGTFALTTEAYRADASTQTNNLLKSLFGEQSFMTRLSLGLDAMGLAMIGAGGLYYDMVDLPTKTARFFAEYDRVMDMQDTLLGNKLITVVEGSATKTYTYYDLMGKFCEKNWLYHDGFTGSGMNDLATMDFHDRYLEMTNYVDDIFGNDSVLTPDELDAFYQMQNNVADAHNGLWQTNSTPLTSEQLIQRTAEFSDASSSGLSLVSGTLFIAGGVMMLASAVVRGIAIYNYFHPDYDDIPAAMVDLIDTVDGDRYIKYDAVLEAEARDGLEYVPGDTNAFEGERWNALYYTKSYEAGKPLLASFQLSNDNNVPDKGYAPIRRFGEVICYDLNRYTFDWIKDVIYVSVEQSEHQKFAVTGVPDLVGSMFSAGWALLAGGVGALIGVGATIGTQSLIKRKKHTAEKTSET